MDYFYLERLKKPAKKSAGENLIKKKLPELLEKSVKEQLSGIKEIPIAFSGGLDSSILACLASRYAKPILFCVGFKNSYDIANAKKTAKILNLNLNLNTILLDRLDLKKYRIKTIDIIGMDNKLQVELGLPLLVLCEKLKKKNYKYLMTGQAADTLFGGFDKYLRSKDLEEDIYKAVRNIYESNLKRDLRIGEFYGIDLLFPFLAEEAVNFALKIPIDLKIKNNIRKHILRQSFRGVLPDEILNQNKKALQYGSGTHKALKKLFLI